MSDRSQAVESKCGEMSEWFKEHAWKTKLASDSESLAGLLFDDLGKHAFELVGIERFREVMMNPRVGR